MKTTLENFRALVLLSAILAAIALGISFAGMPVTSEQEPFMSGTGAGSLASPTIVVLMWLSWIFLYFLAHALAFFFIWFARPIFVITFVIDALMSAFGGLVVSDPWSLTIWTIHNAVATFAVGMLFFSPAVISRLKMDMRKNILAAPPESGPATPIVVPQDGL